MTDAHEPSLVELPLFPLQTVLVPGAMLPLRIFELRYLEMVGRCLREDTGFGVVALTEGAEVQRPRPEGPEGFADESFCAVGTLARVEWHARPQAGLITLRARGTRRFRLSSRQRRRNGLWVGHAELLPEDPAIPVPEDLRALASRMGEALSRWEASRGQTDPSLPPRPWPLQDCGWLSWRWCELLPLSAALRQRLLEIDSPLLRLELVSDLLDEIGAPGE